MLTVRGESVCNIQATWVYIRTWATGGRANLRDSSGVPLYSSSCSSADGPSSASAGRLYCATNESMLAAVCVEWVLRGLERA
jgi:hypothetical protein